MLFLCLAILSSSAISLLMRISSDKISAKLSMLGVNYLVCTLISAGYCGFELLCPGVEGFSTTLLLGFVNGILFLGGFVLCQWNTQKNGIVLTSIFMKLGLLVPMVLSVFLFRELPTWTQGIGFFLALAAILVINLKKESGRTGSRWTLPVMLLMCGGADAMSKVFEVFGSAALSDQFLFYTFAVALILCILMVLFKGERPGIRELLFGTAMGIPNFFASKFLLLSLGDLPAVVVFPSFSIATMLVATLAGVALYKERLGKLQWIALAAIIAALFLLNI
jgi:drug/metabolite transporter (DMT)-like permease